LAKAYRVKAGEQRAAASQETLPNRREIHEHAAMLWERMAQEIEDADRLAIENAAENAARKAAEALRAADRSRRVASLKIGAQDAANQ